MGQLARRRFMRYMRTGPVDGVPAAGGGGAGAVQGGQNQGGGQQGAGGGGPPNGQQQNQQGQQGGQQNQGGSVLDAARQGVGGFDGNQQQNQGQQNQQQQGGGQQGGLSQDVLDAIGRTVQSAVDRHVNTINNPGGGRNRNQGDGNQQQNQQGNDGGQQQTVHRVDQGARREARLAFREYVSDAMNGRFLSDVERQAAVQMGTAAIATWDGDGDADQYGHQVAQTVATTVKELAKSYERLTIEGLRKAGRLKDDGQGPGAGSGPAGFALPAAATGFVLPTTGGQVTQKNPAQAVANAAALAGEYNQRAGHVQQATT